MTYVSIEVELQPLTFIFLMTITRKYIGDDFMAEIKQGDHQFYIGEDEQNPDAKITFRTVDDSTINVDHTGVPESMGGQGIGTQLVSAVVDYARDNNLKVQADCPFAKSVFGKHEDFQDVYAK